MKLLSRYAAPPFVYHEAYSCPWPEKHRFPMPKFRALKDVLVNGGIFKGDFAKPPHPLEVAQGLDAIYLTHERQYVDRFLSNTLSKEETRRIGLDFNEHLVYRTLAEVGGTIHASDLALKYGLAINGAGGTHHAHFTYGSGFTIINDLAVTAKRLVHLGLAKSVLIFDLDVHQGDGTASLCASDANIHTVSIHCENNFPFVKAKSDIDVGLEIGTSDEVYLSIIQSTLQDCFEKFKPDFVLYDAGVDISEFDLLGKLKVSEMGIYARDYTVLEACVKRGIAVCGVIGGGYDSNLPRLAARHSLLHRAAIGVWTEEKMEKS